MTDDPICLISNWIPKLDALPLECDGMTRCISALLADAKIEHLVHFGELSAQGRKPIIHCWIELSSSEIVDLRARMWMGDKPGVPHGVFTHASASAVSYMTRSKQTPDQFAASNWLFEILTGQSLEAFKG
ncbi:hypothetical protein V8Z74_14640 [Comamonas sp. w2-DMI]|uniref:hypothetical protein n=1 Tax=Comamonas sp. w2-DMI TaxID=3126391 RepID=UPI0032E48EBD